MNTGIVKFLCITIFLLCSCGPKTGDDEKGKGKDKSNDEFSQRSKLCQELDEEKCASEPKCELISKVCLPKLPTKFSINPLNLAAINNKLGTSKITALAKGILSDIYIGTDDGLIIWGLNTRKIQDFSNSDPALQGLKYVRAIGTMDVAQRAYVAIGKNGDTNDPDSKIIYEITQNDTFALTPPSALEITTIVETTQGVMLFGGPKTARIDILGNRAYSEVTSLSGATASVFNPNGSNVLVGTGGTDATKHVGIKLYDAGFKYVPVGSHGTIEPSTWGSTTATRNADISSMALYGSHILVGLRAKKGDPNTGGIVVINIYRSNKVQNGKPYLLGTDVKNITVSEFTHGGHDSDLKKKAILMATGDTGLYELTLKRDFVKDEVTIASTAISVDKDNKPVDIKSVDYLFQRDPSQMWFSSDNILYFVDVN